MKTILVTGGAGFIGSNFVRHIFKKYSGYKIIVLDALTYAGNIENIPLESRNSERFEFWYGDVNNLDLVSDLVGRSDVVVHFAAETHVDRIERFIHISTSEVYGSALYEPMDEDHPLNPTTPYAAAKAGADRLVHSYVVSYDIPGVIIRPFNNYGPSQHLEKVIPRFITSALLGEPLTIHGDGTAERDWVFVDDTAEAVDKAVHAPIDKVKGEVFNAGSGKSISVLKIAEMICDVFGLDESRLEFMEERFGQVEKHISSTDKIANTVSFRTNVGFEDGLKRTIEWYKNNKAMWEKQVSMRKVPVKDKKGNIIWY